MKRLLLFAVSALTLCGGVASAQVCPYDPRCLDNPYGAGSPYKSDGFNNPYSKNGSPYSDTSPNNPYATNAPKIYDQQGNYRGKMGGNPYDPDSTSNPYGRYGSPYSPDSPNNPHANHRQQPYVVVPSDDDE